MKTSRTCDQLGVCQRRTHACTGCAWRLAPGTVEGPFKKKRFVWLQRNRPRIVLWLLVGWHLAFYAALVGFALGYTGVLHG